MFICLYKQFSVNNLAQVTSMYIDYIEAENFRGLPKLFLQLNKKLNVFIGNNGVGKTSMVDLLTHMLAQCRILSEDRLSFKLSDIQNGQDALSCRIICHLEEYNSYLLAEYSMKIHAIL